MLIVLASCSINKQISGSATNLLFKDSAISTGHIGICIYQPDINQYWYNYDATKYFVPASNTKLFTLYAGMKYLGDSLVGLKYTKTDNGITIYPTGDPTFLHPDFKEQPVYDFLKNTSGLTYSPDFIASNDLGLGNGWAWDDYKESFMPHRSMFPVYGNLYTIIQEAGLKFILKHS
ncbi:MAG: D-alanyl-D-alanine carboxypeptidase [Ferruginibacter sp.]